jgi:hypothetical protein
MKPRHFQTPVPIADALAAKGKKIMPAYASVYGSAQTSVVILASHSGSARNGETARAALSSSS